MKIVNRAPGSRYASNITTFFASSPPCYTVLFIYLLTHTILRFLLFTHTFFAYMHLLKMLLLILIYKHRVSIPPPYNKKCVKLSYKVVTTYFLELVPTVGLKEGLQVALTLTSNYSMPAAAFCGRYCDDVDVKRAFLLRRVRPRGVSIFLFPR